MQRMGLRCLVIVLLFWAAAGAPAKAAEIPLIERALDLASPEATVETFTALHRAGDFESLWFVLDPALRKTFAKAISLFELEPYVAPGADIRAVLDKAAPFTAEHASDPKKPMVSVVDTFPFFLGLMAAAREDGVQAFDLSGRMRLEDTSDGEAQARPVKLLKFRSATAGRLEFVLCQAPSKRWRIYGLGANLGTAKETRWVAEVR